ncbi:MAG TPA: twin-arginine translocase TatA/TatE family subunit [Bacteroidales bacterium]|nr:twin-arginine translocase TatA/TatE family subunit [Bacteroidales bacterium]
MSLTVILGIIGPTEFILILLVVVLLFGGKKIPQLMKGLGEGIKEFKKASKVDDTAPAQK